jgi:uracil-DNA glycosylase
MAARLREKHPDARYELDWQTPEQLLVATMLAAGSKDTAVNGVTKTLFARWPDLHTLAAAEPSDLQQVLAPLGLAAQKTPRLIGTAKAVVERHGGEVPRELEVLTQLPGVGRKSANVVLTQGFQLPSGIIVDVHVARVSKRMQFSAHDDADDIERDLMQLLPREHWVHFGAAGVLHGRYTCTAQAPRCGECVLADLCPSKSETAEAASPAATATTTPGAWPEEYQLNATAPETNLMPDTIPDDWAALLDAELASDWYKTLDQRVKKERKEHNVYPPVDQVFTAFRLTPLSKLRVVLLGQDPYHGAGQAHGLAFSVMAGVKPPPSLVNIYKELKTDVGCSISENGDLTCWAEQGVLLLNTALTVREAEPGSHSKWGWEKLTDAVIQKISAREEHTVFVLWGGHARKKVPLIDTEKHTIVEGAHPSPLSQKLWFGSKPFSAINKALTTHGQEPINWQVP